MRNTARRPSRARTTGARRNPEVHVHHGVVVWAGGRSEAPFDVWFHPAFGDSRLSYRHVFESALAKCARVFVYDPPGHGASPPRPKGFTVADGARLWYELIARFSGSRAVVLVGHSMAGIIATRTAALLRTPPMLVIGVEPNLTRADAYFSGLAARFNEPATFYASFRRRIIRMARRDEIVHRFACSVEFADPMTLWTLGRSVLAQEDPGERFRRLRCPTLLYWDPISASRGMRDYIVRHRLPDRRFDHHGHWPMITAAGRFYAAIADDVRKLHERERRRVKRPDD